MGPCGGQGPRGVIRHLSPFSLERRCSRGALLLHAGPPRVGFLPLQLTASLPWAPEAGKGAALSTCQYSRFGPDWTGSSHVSNAEPITVARGMEYADEAGPGRGLQKPGEGLGQPRWSTQGWGCWPRRDGRRLMKECQKKRKRLLGRQKKNAASCHSRA